MGTAVLVLVAGLFTGCADGSSPLGIQDPEPEEGESLVSGDDDRGSAGNYPNEPASYRLIAESDMSDRFPWGPASVGGGTGSWWQWEEGDSDTSLHSGDGVPRGPHYNRTRYRAGLAPGGAPVHWGGWNAGSAQQGDEYERIYFSQHIRLVDPGTGDWESQEVGTKLGFFGVGRCSGANNEFYQLLEGGTRSAFTLRMMQQNVAANAYGQNRQSGPVMRVGQWHHWEIEMVLNDVGRENGVVRWWVDGQLIMEHRDVVFRTASDSCGFLAYKWNPTWGGMGGPNRSRTGHIDISDIRISGKPLN